VTPPRFILPAWCWAEAYAPRRQLCPACRGYRGRYGTGEDGVGRYYPCLLCNGRAETNGDPTAWVVTEGVDA
jgi:hypothetical protein